MNAPDQNPAVPPDQFVLLLTGQQSRLLAFIHSLLPDYAAARDVLQETNVVLWSKAGQFQAGTNFYAWACQIARLEVLAHYRSRKRPLVFDSDLLEMIADEAQQRSAASDERSIFLDECLGLLDQEGRRLLRERYASGGTVKSLAARRGEPENRLSVRLSRLRQALLECVERKLAQHRMKPAQEESP